MVAPNEFRTFQAKNAKQASRLRPPPPKLASLIDQVNILPPELPLLSFGDALSMAESESGETTPIDRARVALNVCLTGLTEKDHPPEAFRDYILGIPESNYFDPINALERAVSRYVNFREARLKLYGVAKINTLTHGRLRDFERFVESLGAGTRTQIDEEGRVHFTKDWFGEAVDGVEAARVRQCGVCHRVFWAGRKDQSGCNPRCADILRKRNKRKRDSENKLRDKDQRIKNEAYKERIALRRVRPHVNSPE